MKKLLTLTTGLVLAFGVAAQANSVDLSVFQSDLADTSGVNVQFNVNATTNDRGMDIVRYRFANDSSNGLSLVGIYWESELGSLITSIDGANLISNGSPDLRLSSEVVPPLADWTGSFATLKTHVTEDGIEPGEYLAVVGEAATNAATADIIASLEDVGSRVALLMKNDANERVWLTTGAAGGPSGLEPDNDQPGDEQPGDERPGNGDQGGSDDVNVVPVPAALWPGLALIGGLVLRRRRA